MFIQELNIFEIIMMLAFGSSWPFSVKKTIKTKNVKGKSLMFLIFIFTGYVSGIIFKVTTNFDIVVVLYLFNGSMVLTEIILTLVYNKCLEKVKTILISKFSDSNIYKHSFKQDFSKPFSYHTWSIFF